ncbi:MAG: GNAT family N-acetyltransferase [Nitrososphaerota archaeon]|nr:GNAT family N-acetyltransferase [Nitrososphaerota archaeon]
MDEDYRMELLNETGFWSKWARLRWNTRTRYEITWPEFKEPLFNHVGVVQKWNPTDRYTKQVERRFVRIGSNPAFFVPDTEDFSLTVSKLDGYGFKKEDSLIVYESAEDIQAGDEVQIRTVGNRGIGEWARIYTRAFYGMWFTTDALARALSRALAARGSRFILAKVGGLPVGCTAVFTTRGYTGAYCVGVLNEYRNRGVARAMLAYSRKVAAESGTKLVVQTFESDGLQKFYEKIGFRRLFSRLVLMKKIIENAPENEIGVRFQPPSAKAELPGKVKLNVKIERSLGLREYSFIDAFPGFDKLAAVKGIFGESTPEVLRKVKVVLDPREGYLHVDNEDGTIYLSQPYLKQGEEVYIYLDLIHELVHVKQFMEGKELYDRRYEYFERPTEVEAYRVGVQEARRLGLSDKQIEDYLRVDWVEEDEFRKFLKRMNVGTKP